MLAWCSLIYKLIIILKQMVSSDDHCQEVVGLCREKTYAGLVGCSGEYLVFQPPRYFSSSQLKLTYRVSYTCKSICFAYKILSILIQFMETCLQQFKQD